MRLFVNELMENRENSGAGWQIVAWASGFAVSFVILAAMSDFT